jgi:F-type H+-transporting ATPase subunit c
MDQSALSHALAAVAAAIAAIGGSIGIAIIGSKALDAIARQPEEKKDIRTNMILMAALIEGLAFFSAIIALLVIFLG